MQSIINIFLIIGIIVSTMSANAVQYDCACLSAKAPVIEGCPAVNPAADPLLKNAAHSVQNVSCVSSATISQDQLNMASQVVNALTQESEFKSEQELFRYLSCNRDPGRYFCDFKKYYYPYMKHASETMGIPVGLLACMSFQESHFNPNLASSKGAVGLVQFMSVAWNTGGLKEATLLNYSEEQLAAKKKECESLKKSMIDESTITTPEQQVIADKVFTQYGICKRKVATSQAWKKYYNGTINKIPLTYQHARCPQHAYAMAGAKFYFDAYTRFSSMQGESVDEFKLKNDNYSTLLILLAGYNMGINGVASLCTKVTSEQACLASINEKAPSETRNYIDKIGTCMKKGSNSKLSTEEACPLEVHGCGK